MKSITQSAVVIAALSLWVIPATSWASSTTIAKQIIQLERKWSAATVVHDPSVVEQLLADDYVGIDGRGVFSNKADEVKEASVPDATAPQAAFTVIAEEVTDFNVRVYGDAAIVNARTVQQQTDKSGTQREVQL